MRWHGHTLTPDSKIPSSLAQHHWAPSVGDRLTAWNHARGGALDGNLYPAAGDIWFLHWLDPRRNGYTRITEPNGHVRPMTRAELRRPATRWSHAGIKSWTDRHGQHPMTALEGYTWAVAHGTVIAGEPKGPAWAKNSAWFHMLADIMDRAGHPRWVKRIATLRFPRGVVHNAHEAGIQVAAIFGKGVRGRARRLRATARFRRRGAAFDATW